MQTINNVTTVTSDTGTQTASASVGVGQVQGASTVPTGLTNDLFLDSFFLPMVIALVGVWAYKSGILNSFGFMQWVGNRKAKGLEFSAQQKLQQKIEEIKNKEQA